MTSSLFNNSTLADVKIKQIYHGKVLVYHAHKAILCMASSYFLNMFTSGFQEASKAVIEIHDDHPDDFELLLKLIYTGLNFEDKLVYSESLNNVARIRTLIGVRNLADKYQVPKIGNAAAAAAEKLLREGVDPDTLHAALKAYYGSGPEFDSPLGRLIAHLALHSASLSNKPIFPHLLHEYPMFAADVALVMNREDTIDVYRRACPHCREMVLAQMKAVKLRGLQQLSCPFCRTTLPLR